MSCIRSLIYIGNDQYDIYKISKISVQCLVRGLPVGWLVLMDLGVEDCMILCEPNTLPIYKIKNYTKYDIIITVQQLIPNSSHSFIAWEF